MTDSDKDELLLEKAKRGNLEAFLLLYQRHRSLIFRFLYRLLGSPTMAEEITHDSFVSLIRGSEKSSSFAPTSTRTRLYSTARTRAMEYLEDSGKAGVAKNAENVDMTSRTHKPDTLVQDGNLASEVAQTVASLPPLEREALILSEYEGLELHEIAAIVGADMITVAARLASARQRLRNALANHLHS